MTASKGVPVRGKGWPHKSAAAALTAGVRGCLVPVLRDLLAARTDYVDAEPPAPSFKRRNKFAMSSGKGAVRSCWRPVVGCTNRSA